MITSKNVHQYEPRSESRPDLVLDYWAMQSRIAIRKQFAREKQFILVLLGMTLAAMVGLSIYHNVYEVHHAAIIARIFN